MLLTLKCDKLLFLFNIFTKYRYIPLTGHGHAISLGVGNTKHRKHLNQLNYKHFLVRLVCFIESRKLHAGRQGKLIVQVEI